MANRYWVGGSATWDATAGTKWSTTSGGASGAAVPTAADDVFFDAASGAVTVTTSGTTTDVARSITFTGFTGTFSHAAATTVTVGDASGGALTLVSGMTYTLGNATTSAWSLVSSSTNGGSGWALDFGGKTTGNVTFNGAGKWVYQAAHTTGSTAVVTLTAGTVDTNGQSMTWGQFQGTGASTKALTLGASSVTILGAGSGAWNFNGASAVTFTAGTSTITLSGAAGVFNSTSTGVNYNTVNLTGSGAMVLNLASGGTTFANLGRTGTATKTDSVQINTGILTVSGTLTLAGNSVTNRLIVQNNTAGTARTWTCNGTVTASNVNFSDITGAGSASWNLSAITGGSGDLGGNSGITFTTAQTNYAIVAAAWDTTSSWSLTSGGGATGRVPLPQDTARLDASSPAGTYTPIASGQYGTLDCTGFTRTLSLANAVSWYGSWTLGSGSTITLTGTQTLAGRGTNTITTAGKTVTATITVAAVTGTYTLQDAFTTSRSTSGAINISSGNLNFNGQSVTLSGSAATVSITGGSLTATGTTVSFSNGAATNTQVSMTSGTLTGGSWSMSSTSGTVWTVTGGTVAGAPSATLASASASTRTFAGGDKTYGTLDYTVAASTGQLSITGANTFATINVSGGSRTLAFTAATTTTVTTAFNVFGTAGNLVTIGSLTAASHTLTKSGGGTIGTVDYVSISRSTATPGSTWYAGANSTDGGNNSGWTFTAAPSGSPYALAGVGHIALASASTTGAFSYAFAG